MKVTIKDNTGAFKSKTIDALDSALARMSKDIKQIAWITIPFKSGDLQKKTKEERLSLLRHRIVANTAYASYQEKGRRSDGTHVVRNYSTPGTGKNFLLNAGNKVCKQGINYLKQANNLIRL